MADSGTHLRPCPLSAYRIETGQAWRLLLVFAVYQAFLATSLLVLFLTHLGPSHLGQTRPELFAAVTACYTALSWISLIFIFWRFPAYRIQAASHLLLDLVALAPLIYACGGLGSGFGVLLAVSVAASGLLLGGRCALGYAASATLAVLAVETYADWHGTFSTSHYSYAGMLGVTYFTIALLAISLARRAERSEALADRRQIDLANLQRLNEFIVRHLQSGILVLDSRQRVRLINEAAMRLLKLSSPPHDRRDLPDYLNTALEDWHSRNTERHSATLTAPQGPLHLRANRLPVQGEALEMIFIEDDTLHQQRVQESKLASLGRLAAGIAHEIRNPLGAIGHAAQLLNESEHLDDQDLRLVAIIRKHVRRVDETIGNVLQLSRRHPAHQEKVHLNAWLERFCHEFQEETQRRILDLQLPPRPLNALVDPSQLKQILDNLCHNAIKYGRDGRVLVRLGEDRERPCIEVIDQGSGIAEEHLPHIFEPFFTTSNSGTGLGLYIARELAQLNKAVLDYDRTPEGNRFRLILVNADQVTLEL